MKKQQFNSLLISIATTAVVLIALALLIWLVILPGVRNLGMLPSASKVSFHDHFGLNPTITTLMMDDMRIADTTAPIVEYHDGIPRVYLSASFIREYVDPFVFWDNGAGVFFVSTLYEMMEFTPGRTNFMLNGILYPMASPIKRVHGEVFLPASLVEGLYPLVVEYAPDYNIVFLTSALDTQTSATISVSSASVHYRPESRAPIAIELSRGDEVIVFLNSGFSDSDFVRVRTSQGLVGYMLENELDDMEWFMPVTGDTILPNWIDNWTHRPRRWHGGPINFVWEAAHNQDANRIRMQTPFHHSVTVVSPTWFDFDAENHSITSVVNREYVEWANSQGVYVWPMVFDVNNFSARTILMNRDARSEVISLLVAYVDEYNLDGICLDIEHLRNAEEGPYKIQFIRELSVALGRRDVILSAAVKVPESWNLFYRHDLIGKTVDFVMVMTYDQYYTGGGVAGPVAALPWVQRHILTMLELVPHDRLLMGLPFYNRIWREDIRNDDPATARHMGMDATRELFEENDVIWEWDETASLYYGNFLLVEEGRSFRHRVWLKDAGAISRKMAIYRAHDLAGVASWRRGFENEEVWTILGHYFP